MPREANSKQAQHNPFPTKWKLAPRAKQKWDLGDLAENTREKWLVETPKELLEGQKEYLLKKVDLKRELRAKGFDAELLDSKLGWELERMLEEVQEQNEART